jgi:methyltransferase (TIGR00027 family)
MATISNLQVLQSVSDTALLVTYHRAMETKRPDALFKDDFAVWLSRGRGEQIARRLPQGRALAWTTIVRTVLLDEIILRLVRQGVDTVVNLAAGLDTRPYRLPLPASLRWIEVDLPDLMREKVNALAASTSVCVVERVSLDLADPAWRRDFLAQVGAKSRNALILSEGLLAYLPPSVVGELAEDLHAQTSFRHWAIDLVTPTIKQRINRLWGPRLRQAHVQYQFAPEEGTKFFLPHGWYEAEFHALFDNSIRLRRTIGGMWIFRLMEFLAPKHAADITEKRRAGVVLLERAGLSESSPGLPPPPRILPQTK